VIGVEVLVVFMYGTIVEFPGPCMFAQCVTTIPITVEIESWGHPVTTQDCIEATLFGLQGAVELACLIQDIRQAGGPCVLEA